MDETVIALIEKHGWHEPTDFNRSMGLYCHCGKYCPKGMDEWRKHVTRVTKRALGGSK